MDALPTVPIGRSRLVEREALRSLLAEVRQAEDPSAVLEAARRQGKATPRRKLRELLPHNHPPAAWDALPANLHLAPGEVRITYGTLEELALALLELSSLLDTRMEEFAQRYEIRIASETARDPAHGEAEAWFQALERPEAQHSTSIGQQSGRL